jgi:tetratricopeptide (TPR) repeat protein
LLASLAGRPRRPVGQLIRELLRARLLSEVRPGRYAQHDLIAVYATELAADHDPPIEQEQGAERLLDHFTRTVQSINVRHLRPLLQTIEGDPAPGVSPETFDDVLPALDWYRAEMDTMCAALLDAYRRGRNPWPTVVDSFRAYLRLNRFLQWEKFARPSLVAAMAAGDRMAEAHLRRTLGHLTAILHTDEEGAAEFRRSLALFESLGAEVEQAAVEENLAEIHALAWEPDYRRAVPHYERAAALFAANGHQTGRLYALIELGRCQLELGRTEQGIATLTEGLEAFLHTGDLYRAAIAFWHLGAAARRPDTADFLLMSHRLYAEAGDRFWVLVTGLWLGEAYLAAGRWHDAYAVWRRAQEDHTALTSEPTSTISDDMRTRLARLTAAFDPPS